MKFYITTCVCVSQRERDVGRCSYVGARYDQNVFSGTLSPTQHQSINQSINLTSVVSSSSPSSSSALCMMRCIAGGGFW